MLPPLGRPGGSLFFVQELCLRSRPTDPRGPLVCHLPLTICPQGKNSFKPTVRSTPDRKMTGKGGRSLRCRLQFFLELTRRSKIAGLRGILAIFRKLVAQGVVWVVPSVPQSVRVRKVLRGKSNLGFGLNHRRPQPHQSRSGSREIGSRFPPRRRPPCDPRTASLEPLR